jgi:carboxypeptidase PM20D1
MLLMGHMDVVPPDAPTERQWTHPPFAGQIADGYIWGRGTMDDKVSVLGILEAVEYLLSAGFQPQRTLYLAFGHDEEIGGQNGAGKIAELLGARGVELDYVLDEGMNVVDGIIPGIAAPAALIGIAEKGYLSLDLSVQTAGGQSSIPPVDTAIGIISRALQRLEAAPFPARLSGSTRQMLEFLGPEMAWAKRLRERRLFNFWSKNSGVAARQCYDAATWRRLCSTEENVLPSQARRGQSAFSGRLSPAPQACEKPSMIRSENRHLPIRMEPSAVSDIEAASFN